MEEWLREQILLYHRDIEWRKKLVWPGPSELTKKLTPKEDMKDMMANDEAYWNMRNHRDIRWSEAGMRALERCLEHWLEIKEHCAEK